MLSNNPIIKIVVVCLLYIFCISKADGQLKGYTELSFGPGFPIGDFSKSNDGGGGFAKNGSNLNLKTAIKFKSGKLGLGLLLRKNTYGFNTTEIKKRLEEGFPGVDFEEWREEIKSWRILSATAGINITNHIGKGLSIETGFYLGVANADLGDYILETRGRGTQFMYDIKTSSTRDDVFAFSYLLQSGIYYHVSGKIGVSLNVDYFSLKPKFKSVGVYETYVVTHINGGAAINLENNRHFEHTPKMQSVNVNVGIRYEF